MEKRVKEVVDAYTSSKTDVLGSYTGVPREQDEQPVQDADDL